VSPKRLAIAQVSPLAWEAKTEVGDYVAHLSGRLAARGHQVLVIAPSLSPELVRETRQALRGDPRALLQQADGEPLVLGVGEVLALAPSKQRSSSLPIDVARTIEQALELLPLDVVHVHEPFAPSASSVALRTSRALTVGSFHQPTERVLSTQLGRPLAQRLFSRLDARTASYQATRELMDRYFPAEYRVVLPAGEGRRPIDADPPAGGSAIDSSQSAPTTARGTSDPIHLVLVAEEERLALRTSLRALRLLPVDAPWRVTVWSSRPLAAPATLSHQLRQRVRFVDAGISELDELLAGADAVVLGSEGVRPTPGVLVQALATGVVPVASGLPVYVELLGQGSRGLVYPPGDLQTLASQLTALVTEPGLLHDMRLAAEPFAKRLSFERVADDFEEIYGGLVARRHDLRPRNQAARRAVADRPLIDVDLHMHTDHSYDCATPVQVLLAQARAKGLGAIAVTEHNEISGALAAADLAGKAGVKVIVGEEVKTAEQGEVIGLFIREKIPRGLTLQETIAEIKRQGGIVYVPHPFDRMHSVPDYKHLLDVIDEIDVLEVFNPRVAISEYNEEAVRFAAKYRIIAGAGSDAHVPQGLGSVRIRMRDFDGPEQFLESLRDADITRNPASLFYVQALKFLQTKAMPAGARRAAKERRVRRVARKS
jgi:glycosyltransferase involved in cell wall biosynthesis